MKAQTMDEEITLLAHQLESGTINVATLLARLRILRDEAAAQGNADAVERVDTILAAEASLDEVRQEVATVLDGLEPAAQRAVLHKLREQYQADLARTKDVKTYSRHLAAAAEVFVGLPADEQEAYLHEEAVRLESTAAHGSIGTVNAKFKNGRVLQVYPVFRLEGTARVVPIVGKIEIEWRGKGKNKLFFQARDMETKLLLLTCRVEPEEREVFEKLREFWGYWFILRPDGTAIYVSADHTYDVKHNGPEGVVATAGQLSRQAFVRELRSPLPGGTVISTEDAQRAVTKFEKLGGPLPWPLMPRDDEKEKRDVVVRDYLGLLAALRPATDADSRDLYTRLLRARIFAFETQAALTVVEQATRYSLKVAGLQEYDWRAQDVEKEAAWKAATDEAATRVDFPKTLPFATSWFAWSGGLSPKPRLGVDTPSSILGVLACDDGYLAAIGLDSDGTVAFNIQCAEGAWSALDSGPNLGPWVLTAVLAAVNEHHKYVEQGAPRLSDKQLFVKAAKAGIVKRPIPPMYYTVKLSDVIVRKSAQKEFRRQWKIEWSHRWDVRGHSAARIKRGPLPLDPKLERILVRRGYKIAKPGTPLSAEAYEALMSRDLSPPQASEWVAVLVTWRKGYVKGPADLPYVPSVRRPMAESNGEDAVSVALKEEMR